MQAIDLIIIFGYLIGITVFGIWYAGKQETTEDYFVGNRDVPWWAIAMSIVATETSTITFVSVPGVAFARNGNFEFLQIVFGYMLGRIVISLLFIPLYFRGELQTVYQLLGERFGNKVKMLASSLFVVMRNIADGIRLLLTAIVLAAVYTSLVPGGDVSTAITVSIILLGLVMVIFTFYGGIEAVIWVEVVQLVIYIGGAFAAAIVLINNIDGGFAAAVETGRNFDKFSLVDWGFRSTTHTFWTPFGDGIQLTLPFDLTKTYTFWAGLIGGCFLTMSTHGTDQYMVQRYLCTDKPRSATAALLSSGAIVLVQFIGFLFIGVLLFAFYSPHKMAGYDLAGVAGSGVPGAFPFAKGDQVFPDFITNHMPPGLSGLVVAAIFAAALSSSLNAIASTAINDLYKPFKKDISDKQLLRISGVLTIVIGIVQVVVAIIFMRTGESALNLALSVASLINGPILGVFLVGTFLKGAREKHALIGMLTSIILMIYVLLGTNIAWTWYAIIGSVTTLLASFAATLIFRTNEDSK